MGFDIPELLIWLVFGVIFVNWYRHGKFVYLGREIKRLFDPMSKW